MLVLIDIMVGDQRGYLISSEQLFKCCVPCLEDGKGSEKRKH